MLDYEIAYYKVEYLEIGDRSWNDRVFGTEESAIAFIKDNRHAWDNYILSKTLTAIIDF